MIDTELVPHFVSFASPYHAHPIPQYASLAEGDLC